MLSCFDTAVSKLNLFFSSTSTMSRRESQGKLANSFWFDKNGYLLRSLIDLLLQLTNTAKTFTSKVKVGRIVHRDNF